ncbi:MAG TPA: hypothetical protein V6C76_03475 [Drouetiella sp.]
MGRYDDPRQTDQTQQRQDVQQPGNDGPNRFQSDAYSQGRDKISQTRQFVSHELNGVLSHLQNAESTYEQRGVRAATGEYAAAIRAADSIDQQAVARERANVRQQLQSGQLDAQTRRALIQEDADLHTLQRAPGFARANFALLMIRNGDQYYGTQLLLEAEQKDPEMNQDANFQRHFKNAVDAARGAQGQQPTDGSGQQQINPGDQRQQNPGGDQRQQNPGGDQTQQPTDNTQQQQRVSPLDAQNRTPVESVQALFGSVTGPGTMTPEVKQAFQQAIANADAGQSPKLQGLLQAEQQAAQNVKGLAEPNLVAAVTAQDKAAQDLIQKMPADKQAQTFQLYNALDKASSAQERQSIEQQLVQANPGLQQILANRDQAMGAQNIQNLMQYMTVENSLQAEKNQAAITRFTYAMALQKNGDTAEAKQQVTDALQKNTSTDPELNAFWQRTAQQMGVTTDSTQSQQRRPGDTQNAAQPGTSAADILADAERKFQAVVQQKGDVKAAFQQLAPQFGAAEQKADAEFTQIAKTVGARDAQLQADIAAKMTPEVKQQLTQIGAQIDQEKAKLTPQSQQLWNKYQDSSTSDADRQAIHAQLVQANPNLAKLADQLEQTVGKDTLNKISQLATDHAAMQGAVMGRFLTRYYAADAAATAGDKATAQQQFGAAFSAVPQEFQAQFAKKPEVQALAQKVGIDLTKLPAPPDAVLQASGVVKSDAAQPGQPGADQAAQPGATNPDGSQNVPGVSAENQGLRPDQIMARAVQTRNSEGMTANTKRQYEDAIKVADSMYGAQDKQVTDQLLNVLATGKKTDGTDLSPQERMQAHGLVQKEFQGALGGLQLRLQYAQALNDTKQFASAEKVYKDTVTFADKLPIDQFQKELTQLGKDVQNPSLSRANQADCMSFMQDIQGSGTSKDNGLLYVPITARKVAAAFYVGGAQGENGIVKPEQAAAMIDQARLKEKELYGVPDDKAKAFDPTLAKNAEYVSSLLPENIRKQKAQADNFWSNAPVDVGAAALAMSATMIVGGLLTKNGTMAKIGLATAEGEGFALNTAGKLAMGGTMIAGAGLARHELHQWATGENEDWSKSYLHGTAGLAMVGSAVVTRNAISKLINGGSTVTAEMAEGSLAKMGLAKDATLADLNAVLGKGGRAIAPEARAALGGEAATAKILDAEGKVNPAAIEALKTYTPAQLANLQTAAASTSWWNGGKLSYQFKSTLTGYGAGVAGIGSYNAITAFDGGVGADGKPMNWSQAFMDSSFKSGGDNLFLNALMLTPMLKDGAIRTSVWQKESGILKNSWNVISAPLSPSALGGFGPEALAARNMPMTGLRAAQMAGMMGINNTHTLGNYFTFKPVSNQYESMLKRMNAPLTDAAPVGGAPRDTQVLAPKPAGQTDAAPKPAPVKDNGQPIQDQPVDQTQQQQQQQQQGDGGLAAGTPGL